MVDSPWYILVWMIHLIPELLANFQGSGFVLNKRLSPKGLLDWDGVFSWPDFLVPRKIQKGKGQKKISVPAHSVLLFGSHALLHRRGPSSQEALQSSSTAEQCYLRVADSVWTEKEVEMEMKVEGANRTSSHAPTKDPEGVEPALLLVHSVALMAGGGCWWFSKAFPASLSSSTGGSYTKPPIVFVNPATQSSCCKFLQDSGLISVYIVFYSFTTSILVRLWELLYQDL